MEFTQKQFKRLLIFCILAVIISTVAAIYLAVSFDMISVLKTNQSAMECFLADVRREYVVFHGNETAHPAEQQDVNNSFNYLGFSGNEAECGQQMELKFKPIPNPPDFSKLLVDWETLSKGKFDGLTIYFQENGLMRATFIKYGMWRSYEEGNYRYNDMLIWYDESYPESPKTSWEPRLERKLLYYKSPPGRGWVQLLTSNDGISTGTGGDWYYSSAKQYDG